MMAIVQTLGKKVIKIACAYVLQNTTPNIEKRRFYDEVTSEWYFRISSEIIVSLRDFNGHMENVPRILNVYMGEWYLEKTCRRKIPRIL